MMAEAKPKEIGIALSIPSNALQKKAQQIKIPITYREAMLLPEKEFWFDAIQNQLAKLQEAKAYCWGNPRSEVR